jgi:hypothetical protein
MKNDKKDKKVRDDFYDRVNYYETRNIFSSNEVYNPGNRLYTDQAVMSHPVWSTIGKTNNEPVTNDKPKIGMESCEVLISNLNKLSSTSSSIACKKCGYGK